MRTDDDVDLPLFQAVQYLFDVFRRTCPADILDPAGEILQTFGECLIVLESENGGRDQHRHLFVVSHSLEGGADRDFGFTETYVAADQAVHWAVVLHVCLHVGGRLHLVRRIFVDEAGLQLVLHEAVRAVGKALFLFPLGVEEDQVAGDVFDFRLGPFLHLLPGSGPELT